MVVLAHNGDLEYIAEATYGAGFPATGQLEIPSDSVIDSTLEVRRVLKRHHTISTDAAVDTTFHSKVYVLTVNYAFQQCKAATQHLINTILPYYATHRTNGDLDSLAINYDTNGTNYGLYGAKINNLGMSMSQDEAVTVTTEIWGKELETETTAATFTNYSSLTPAGTISEDIDIFEGAVVTRAGSWADGIQSFDFTINNNLDRIPKLGSDEAIGVYPAHTDLTGSVDIITAAGGEVDVDELLDGTETSIIAQTGSTASKSAKFTFTKAAYARTPVPYRVDMSAVLVAADWEAESVTLAAVT